MLTVTLVDTPYERVEFSVAFNPEELPSAELFTWFVEPAKLMRWWAEEATVEPVVGGEYRMHWPSIEKTMTGQILELVPGERLVFSWSWADGSERPKEVVVEVGEGSATLTHGDYIDSASDRGARGDHVGGWQFFFSLMNDALTGAR